MRTKKKYIYIHYDKAGNVAALADTAGELAKLTGRRRKSIYDMIARKSRRWAKVEVEDDE